MELPKVLEQLMVTLLKENELKSWSVYQGNNGLVNLSLKFSSHESETIAPLQYRKLSDKQSTRNTQRVKAHQDKPSAIQQPHAKSGNRPVTRTYAKDNPDLLDDKELARSDTEFSDISQCLSTSEIIQVERSDCVSDSPSSLHGLLATDISPAQLPVFTNKHAPYGEAACVSGPAPGESESDGHHDESSDCSEHDTAYLRQALAEIHAHISGISHMLEEKYLDNTTANLHSASQSTIETTRDIANTCTSENKLTFNDIT